MKLLARILFAIYLGMLVWLVLFKLSISPSSLFTYPVTSFNLVPFAASGQGGSREILYNLLAFIPFGILLSVCTKRLGFGTKLMVIGTFSLSMEVMQYALAIGAADITDLITNSLGGLVGLVIYIVSNRYFDNPKLDKMLVITSLVLLILCLPLLGIFLSRAGRYQSAPRLEKSNQIRLQPDFNRHLSP